MGARRPLLSVGMATYDDFDGVYFTVMSLRLHHPEIADQIEILVIDNHPDGLCAEELKTLADWIPNYRYIPYGQLHGTAVRDLIFREARAEFVMCVDCHVLFAPGSLAKLLAYFRANPDTPDLLQGPLVHDDLTTISTHMDPVWSDGMFGVWATDRRGVDAALPPFEIALHGLGVFACRKAAWPGFNPRLRGFGGEEGYIQEKFRRAGGRALCLPFLRWTHRFGRPSGVPYRNTWEDRIRNYLVVANELGLDPAPALRHFRAHVAESWIDEVIDEAWQELANPFGFFDAIYCINLDRETRRWRQASARFERLGIAARVRRFSAVETTGDHHTGCALSHRAVIAEAARLGLNNVLVFEDDVLFIADAIPRLRTAVAELAGRRWQILYLGACQWKEAFPLVRGATHLARAGAVTCTHAVAYHKSVFRRMLAEIPAGAREVKKWLQTHRGIDQYFAFAFTEGKLILSPVIATQPSILRSESAEVKKQVRRGRQG